MAMGQGGNYRATQSLIYVTLGNLEYRGGGDNVGGGGININGGGGLPLLSH